jgi:aspartyl-tRNA synthetase
VRCFRDEDLRADRQPEFTQVDLEISFPQQETVFAVVEGFLGAAFSVAGTQLTPPFPRMTFDEALRLYGIDKPDLRLPVLNEVREAFAPGELETLAVNTALPVVAVHIPGVGELSRKERDDLRLLYPAKLAQQGTKVFDDFKRLEKMFPESTAKIRALAGATESSVLALVAAANTVEATTEQRGPGVLSTRERQVYEAAGAVRLAIAQKYADRHKLFEKKGNSADYKFLWVTDFPLYEWDEETKVWNARTIRSPRRMRTISRPGG